MLHGVRVVFFTLCLYLGTHLFVFSVLPFALLLSYRRPREIPALKRWFVRCVFAIVGKQVKVSGTQNFEPQRAYVIIANYPSGYAAFALVGAFPQAVLVAHAFLKSIPFLGHALRRLGTVFVRSGKNRRGRQAFDLDLSGRRAPSSVIILPEGGRTPDGRIHRFRRGFLYLLRRTSYDLLPVTLNGL
ncbi:MAG TPA: lysophospholipid acyltransferase family protein, partial [Anaerolineae bacterium]|nr:lysophospholipid acyltransferase family protein [Anaerolineae bacterium]